MSRKLKPLDVSTLGSLPPVCASCAFWESGEPLEARCGAVCDPDLLGRTLRDTTREWAPPGRVAFEDGSPLGFVKYAPGHVFPQAANMPSGPPDEKAALIACMHIDDKARHIGLGKVLLLAAYTDLLQKGVRCVEAYATTGPTYVSPMIGMTYLLGQGFKVVAPHPIYPRLRLDLRTLAVWTENLEAMLDGLRIPLRAPKGVPTTMGDVHLSAEGRPMAPPTDPRLAEESL